MSLRANTWQDPNWRPDLFMLCSQETLELWQPGEVIKKRSKTPAYVIAHHLLTEMSCKGNSITSNVHYFTVEQHIGALFLQSERGNLIHESVDNDKRRSR